MSLNYAVNRYSQQERAGSSRSIRVRWDLANLQSSNLYFLAVRQNLRYFHFAFVIDLCSGQLNDKCKMKDNYAMKHLCRSLNGEQFSKQC